MDTTVNEGVKMATKTIIVALIFGIVLCIFYVCHDFLGRTTSSVESSMANAAEASLYSLASEGTPVPVAAIWKGLKEIDPTGTMCSYDKNYTPSGTDYIGGHLVVYRANGTIVSENNFSLANYLAYKARVSYEEFSNGNYNVTIYLTGG